jgi:hypothetical protein
MSLKIITFQETRENKNDNPSPTNSLINQKLQPKSAVTLTANYNNRDWSIIIK